MQLTDYQQAVVQQHQYHTLCIAVAGSGKTSTLVQLILSLLAQGAEHRRLMVMMFNKAAQLDFDKKLNQQNRQGLALPAIRTYHATGLKLLTSLETWGLRASYNKSPLSDKQQELFIKDQLTQHLPEELKERMRNESARFIEFTKDFIHSVKSQLITAKALFKTTQLSEQWQCLITIFAAFEQWRHQQRAITFIDMLYDPVMLLRQHPEYIARVENKMNFIVVDEYQDTSTLQHEFTKLVAGSRAKVIAVGDPDQTIYEFAGANINNILHHFNNDYSATNTVTELTLPHSFRYGHSLALAASHLIHHNHARKDVLSIAYDSNAATTIQLHEIASDETTAILKQLQQQLQQQRSPQDIAILLRVWAQSVPIELRLLTSNIAYHSEGPSIFQRIEIENLIHVLTLINGEWARNDSTQRYQHLLQLLTFPHAGIKQVLLQQLCQQLSQHDSHIGEHFARYAATISDISPFQRRRLLQRAHTLQHLEALAAKKGAQTLLAHKVLDGYINDVQLLKSLRSMSLNAQQTEEQILAMQGFVDYLKQQKLTVAQSCEHITQLQHKRLNQDPKHQQGVLISTSHRTKGLEWPVVFVPGLTTQYWPFNYHNELVLNQSIDIEAERRLLYVTVTRAKKALHLFTFKSNGRKSSQFSIATTSTGIYTSPFIAELQLPTAQYLGALLHKDNNEELLDYCRQNSCTELTHRYLATVKPELQQALKQISAEQSAQRTKKNSAKKRNIKVQKNSRYTSDLPWAIGDEVIHHSFGSGRLSKVSDDTFEVTFDTKKTGTKRFAKVTQAISMFD